MSDAFYQMTSNTNIALRPLDKGMIRNISSHALPVGSFWTLKNYVMNEDGPMRRPGFREMGGGDSFPSPSTGEILKDLLVYYDLAGGYQTLAISSHGVYKYDMATGYTAITGGSTLWTPYTGQAVDWALITDSGNSYVLFADGNTTIKAYDGSSVATWSIVDENDDPLSIASPGAIESFSNYLWIGKPNGNNINRLWWSNYADYGKFTTTDYWDFSDEISEILRVKSLGNLLIIYFRESVYFGRPTNVTDLPYAFTKLDVGGVGLVGRKALVSWDDGHYFVGKDDIYYLSATSSIERIGSPVIKRMLENCNSPENIYAAVDPENDSIVFGIPQGGSKNISELWYFNYKKDSWSYSTISATMLASIGSYLDYEWGVSTMTLNGISITRWGNDAAGTSFADAGFNSWKDFDQKLTIKDLYIGQGYQEGFVYRSDDIAQTDYGNAPITAEIETGDFDFGAPDMVKTVRRLSLKLKDNIAQDLTFNVWTSVDRGATWHYQNDLVIEAGDDEGKVDFRSTGSTTRCRLITMSVTDPFKIMEIILRARIRGLEV